MLVSTRAAAQLLFEAYERVADDTVVEMAYLALMSPLVYVPDVSPVVRIDITPVAGGACSSTRCTPMRGRAAWPATLWPSTSDASVATGVSTTTGALSPCAGILSAVSSDESLEPQLGSRQSRRGPLHGLGFLVRHLEARRFEVVRREVRDARGEREGRCAS